MTNMPLSLPTGIVNDDTTFANQGRWFNGSLARFYGDSWQVKGGWERLILDNLGGVCRSVMAWTDATNDLNIAFGRHNGLSVWRDSVLYDVTPQVAGESGAAPDYGLHDVHRRQHGRSARADAPQGRRPGRRFPGFRS